MSKNTTAKPRTTDFYEAASLGATHAIYRDDVDIQESPPTLDPATRTTAIITIILISVVAAALGLLLAWGISTLRTMS